MATILDAILKINPNAEVTVNGNDVNSIEWLNDTAQITQTDIEAKVKELEQEEKTNKTNTENAKASGKQKLIDLGLTEAEIKALMGV